MATIIELKCFTVPCGYITVDEYENGHIKVTFHDGTQRWDMTNAPIGKFMIQAIADRDELSGAVPDWLEQE